MAKEKPLTRPEKVLLCQSLGITPHASLIRCKQFPNGITLVESSIPFVNKPGRVWCNFGSYGEARKVIAESKS